MMRSLTNTILSSHRSYLRRPAHLTPLLAIYISSSHLCSANEQDFVLKQNKALSLLIRSGQIQEARRVFDGLPRRNVVTWNSMISGYVRCREIVRARMLFNVMPERDIVSWNSMLLGYTLSKDFGEIEEGRRIFEQMPERDQISWNTMIGGYARSGRMEDAMSLFERMTARNVISWNVMISGFFVNGDVARAVEMFKRMPSRNSASLSALVSGLIQNCKLEDAERFLLNYATIGEIEGAVDAYNTLIAGYGQLGKVADARRLFDLIPSGLPQGNADHGAVKRCHIHRGFERNVISWNSMIMCYVKAGDICSARRLFDEMPGKDVISWNTMISGYVNASDLEKAATLFQEMPHPDARSWNFIISGFAKKGYLEQARDYFDRLPHKSIVSWNTIIAGYEQNGDYNGALNLFTLMQSSGERADQHTLSSVLSACAGLATHIQGIQIHQLITKMILADIPINNSLITMYARCGNVTDARAIFNEMKSQKDVVSWNAMIGGYAQHGLAGESLDLFKEMKRMKVKPTHITFISVMNACGHAGLVAEGQKQFDSMVREFGIIPKVEHYASLVDLIGRYGQLKDAMDIIDGMLVPPDRAAWGALLGACRVHNNMDLAQVAMEALVEIDPDSSAPYVLLHNMHADMGRWGDAIEARKIMDRNGIRKQPGYSWIELQKRVHIFIAGDRSHNLVGEIHNLIESISRIIKDEYFRSTHKHQLLNYIPVLC